MQLFSTGYQPTYSPYQISFSQGRGFRLKPRARWVIRKAVTGPLHRHAQRLRNEGTALKREHAPYFSWPGAQLDHIGVIRANYAYKLEKLARRLLPIKQPSRL